MPALISALKNEHTKRILRATRIRPARSGPVARMSSRSARLPAALAASRQRFSTKDRSPSPR